MFKTLVYELVLVSVYGNVINHWETKSNHSFSLITLKSRRERMWVLWFICIPYIIINKYLETTSYIHILLRVEKKSFGFKDITYSNSDKFFS